MQTTTEENIAADRLTVWGYVVDPTLWPEWLDGMEHAKGVSGDAPAAPGRDYTVRATWLSATTVTIGDMEADERLEFSWQGEDPGSMTIQVEEVSHGASVLTITLTTKADTAGGVDLEKMIVLSAGTLKQRSENTMLDPVH